MGKGVPNERWFRANERRSIPNEHSFARNERGSVPNQRGPAPDQRGSAPNGRVPTPPPRQSAPHQRPSTATRPRASTPRPCEVGGWACGGRDQRTTRASQGTLTCCGQQVQWYTRSMPPAEPVQPPENLTSIAAMPSYIAEDRLGPCVPDQRRRRAVNRPPMPSRAAVVGAGTL